MTADIERALMQSLIGEDPAALPARENWNTWLLESRLHRVVPLLYRLVDEWETDLGAEELAALRGFQMDAMAWAVRLEHHLLALAEMFESEGIAYAVLKGLATAHLDYVDPSLRQVGDIDVLVAPEQQAQAIELVSKADWVQAYELPRRHERFTHAVTFSRHGVELDLHQRVAHRAIGRLVSTDQLLAARVPYEVAGRQLYALAEEDRLIHAALHAVLSRGATRRWSSIADVLVLCQRQGQDAAEVLNRADSFGVRSLIERSIGDAYATVSLAVPAEWRSAFGAPRRASDRLVERAYAGGRRRPVVEELAHVRLLEGWSDRASYLIGLLSPLPEADGRGFLAGVRARLRYLWSKVRGRS